MYLEINYRVNEKFALTTRVRRPFVDACFPERLWESVRTFEGRAGLSIRPGQIRWAQTERRKRLFCVYVGYKNTHAACVRRGRVSRISIIAGYGRANRGKTIFFGNFPGRFVVRGTVRELYVRCTYGPLWRIGNRMRKRPVKRQIVCINFALACST